MTTLEKKVSESIFPHSSPPAIATLVNESAAKDFERFFLSLCHWQEVPLFIMTTNKVAELIKSLKEKVNYKQPIHIHYGLEKYAHMTRQSMERSPSQAGYPNLFYDFTFEKMCLMEWALSFDNPGGVLFCDSDIFWFGKIPTIPPNCQLAVSPHEIRETDKERYGRFNAGFLWTNHLPCIQMWREASQTSHFYEQASIESLIPFFEVHYFGSEVNYGWWRMFQSPCLADEQKAKWSIYRTDTHDHTPLYVSKQPLICIHTHFSEKGGITQQFNEFVLKKMDLVKQNIHIRALQKILSG